MNKNKLLDLLYVIEKLETNDEIKIIWYRSELRDLSKDWKLSTYSDEIEKANKKLDLLIKKIKNEKNRIT